MFSLSAGLVTVSPSGSEDLYSVKASTGSQSSAAASRLSVQVISTEASAAALFTLIKKSWTMSSGAFRSCRRFFMEIKVNIAEEGEQLIHESHG